MVAVVLPDGGRAYLSKVFNDAWMRQYGFLEAPAERTVADVLLAKHGGGEIPPLVTVDTHQRVRDAIALLHEHRVSQLPVVSSHDPHSVVGSIGERGLLRRAPTTRRPERADRRRDGAAVPRGVDDRPRARGRRAAVRRGPGAARDRRRAAGRHRHPRRPAGVPGS